MLLIPEEMNHELQQRLDKELAERERNAALVEVVVMGCWCSPQVMKLVHSHAAHAPMKTFQQNFLAKNFLVEIKTFWQKSILSGACQKLSKVSIIFDSF
jgi:hypothetical protein